MGLALEVVTGRVTNPGATPTALTANSGDTFTVRSFPFGSEANIYGLWAKAATAGTIRVRSPRLHDNVQGIRYRDVAATARNFLSDWASQKLFPQDVLTVEMTGGAAETDVGALLTYYRDLPGTDARLAMWEQVKPRIVNILTVEVAITGAGTLGDWSAGTAIDTTFDLLKANTDYAVLGYQSDTNVNAVALRGPDTGNLRIGGPGTTETVETRDFFVSLSQAQGTPAIPVINAANKGATLAFQNDNAAGATINVGFSLAELSGA